jgi:hypothetical protein
MDIRVFLGKSSVLLVALSIVLVSIALLTTYAADSGKDASPPAGGKDKAKERLISKKEFQTAPEKEKLDVSAFEKRSWMSPVFLDAASKPPGNRPIGKEVVAAAGGIGGVYSWISDACREGFKGMVSLLGDFGMWMCRYVILRFTGRSGL